jgi:tRNA(fMet)-specific endonuclease VapC
MPVYLLDANAISELIHHPHGAVSNRYRSAFANADATILTSIISACEIRYGALKKNAKDLSERVSEVLSVIPVAPLKPGVDLEYAAVRTDLERRGQLIGPNDLLIAAHALALDAVLVTDNVREFKRVKGLRIENWKRE